MNPAKWDDVALRFEAGDLIPANGMEAWREIAISESITIRAALPSSVGTLVEIGCGIGRLTPYLALSFPRVVAVDTSAECLRVTQRTCERFSNVEISDVLWPEGDAAVIWQLYDDEWSDAERLGHINQARRTYPIVLSGGDAGWVIFTSWPDGRSSIRYSEGQLDLT